MSSIIIRPDVLKGFVKDYLEVPDLAEEIVENVRWASYHDSVGVPFGDVLEGDDLHLKLGLRKALIGESSRLLLSRILEVLRDEGIGNDVCSFQDLPPGTRMEIERHLTEWLVAVGQ